MIIFNLHELIFNHLLVSPHHLSFLDKLSLTLTLALNFMLTVIGTFPRYYPFVHSDTLIIDKVFNIF